MQQQPPVIVNQHYYIGYPNSEAYLPLPPAPAPPVPQPQHPSPYGSSALGRFTSSMVNVATPIAELCDGGISTWQGCVDSSVQVYDELATRFDKLMTMIDGEKMDGDEQDLFTFPLPASQEIPEPPADMSHLKPSRKRGKDRAHTTSVAAALSGNYSSKVDLYANSKLAPGLPPLAL